MLQLINITKDYDVADEKVHALKGISLNFRKSEFVSVLGPSGCGKTTMLNIIGGLDHYTSGDLVIDGTSTKQYKDRDWDTYRNHRIGFIFQSYNLIPHQTVLENVELALNIAGVAKAERIEKAKEALDKVGLAGLYKKKPNQLSGGQMQRVAIARALVSDPDILLADEPTGALDTVTSVQIMDLIKEISKERLVIMVTHNPDLAEKYSTRIVQLLDGLVTADSDPYDGVEAPQTAGEDVSAQSGEPSEQAEAPAEQRSEKPQTKKSKLGFWSAFRLSARNLLSKLKRTLLVCFAGSIGIIGVASVLSVSVGVTAYIDNMQNEMLSGNPVTISQTAMNLEGLMTMQDRQIKIEGLEQGYQDGVINVDKVIEYLAKQSDNINELLVQNTITQDYVDYVKAMPKEYIKELSFRYGVSMSNNMFTDYHFTGQEGDRMSLAAAQEMYTTLLGKTDFKEYAAMTSLVTINYSQAPANADFIASQFDIINEGGKIATEPNEIMIVVGEDNRVSDLMLAQLGYFTQDEFLNFAYGATDPKDPHYKEEYEKFTFEYDEILGKNPNKKFYWYPNDIVYTKNNGLNPLKSVDYYPFFYNHKESHWKISDDWATNDDFDGGIELTVTAILRKKKDVQYASMGTGIYYTPALTQKILQNSRKSKIVEFIKNYVPPEPVEGQEQLGSIINNGTITSTRVPVVGAVGITYNYEFIYDGVLYNKNTGLIGKSMSYMNALGGFGGDNEQMQTAIESLANTYTLSVRDLGGEELPQSIAVYPVDFELKDMATDYLSEWNSDKDIVVNGKTLTAADRDDIMYTDNLKIIISLVDGLIQAITASLVAFTSLALVVSTVMIAIITYVSVIERIKEIGVIRSLGGRKRDVARLFNAETFMIGTVSGIFGLIITFIITIIINAIVNSIAGVSTIATLTVPIMLIMMGVSIGLTLISGLIPASLAAKKDPVEALRSE